MKVIFTSFWALTLTFGFAQINRVEPPNWWSGMQASEVQLLFHGQEISKYDSVKIQGPLKIVKFEKAKSPNYLFVTVNTANAVPGMVSFDFFVNGKVKETIPYEFRSRKEGAAFRKGFDSSDVVYLITPDRFANGDPTNDQVNGLNEQEVNRSHDYKRHGGDIQGIIDHLDYIEAMGFTQIWSSPLLINDMHQQSYHGYAMTDFYRVDPRFGNLDTYIELADKAAEKGIGLIMDQVANHCGLEHWWMKDLPFDNWVNFQKDFESKGPFTGSNHRRTANQDRYASKADLKGLNEGWFVSTMPDLNQRNPFLATYLIQNSIWWIETLGLSGIRQDTYPYPDKDFMSDWAGAIMTEYPNFSIVGEEWSYNPLLIGYWQEGANNRDGYDSNLTSSMDFAMQQNIVDALNEEEAWNTGLIKMYEGLANDFYYPNPKDIMIFPDNHDMSRIFTQLKEDVPHTKMALGYLLALPRIPQLYYGAEILMENTAKPGDHGLIRSDFPGGWEGDAVSAFTGKGLTDAQMDMQNFVKQLLNYRKNSKAIHNGETVHFAPFMGTYFLFRHYKDETVVVMLNKNETPIEIDLKRYAEMNLEGKELRNVISGESITWGDTYAFKNKGVTILTTKNQ